MKTLLNTICILILALTVNAQDTIQLSDFKILNNTNWKGKLTYKDYQSGKPTSIDATMQIEIDEEKIVYNIQYTYEPKKNNQSSVKIKKNGTYYGSEKVVSNSFENGVRTFVTTYEGRDNGKKATMYMTRQFSDNTYTVTKEVQLKDSKERFIRNTYEFTKL